MNYRANIFAIVPVIILSDRRLTLSQLRILIALYSFRGKDTDTIWPKRQTLSMRCGGMHVSNISKATTELCELGYLTKLGDGGKSTPARYKLTVPDTLAESTTPPLAESTTPPLAESTTPPLAESTRGKEHTIEHTNKHNAPSPLAMLTALGIPESVVNDFILLRKSKNAPITNTAMEGIKREAVKAGYTVDEVVRICCERGWAGFKAEWVLNKTASQQRKPPASEWISSAAAITEMGRSLEILQGHDETFVDFKARVFQAKGVTTEMVRRAAAARR